MINYANPMPVRILILGQCASKSNGRRIVRRGKRLASIKSNSAMAFSALFKAQCPQLDAPILGDIKLDCNIFYRDRRSDLDESLVMDMLQDCGVIKNDRQIKFKIIRHGIDKNNPRVEITINHMDEEDYPNTSEFANLLKGNHDEEAR
jgi:Holliday junction resolvase RusA-like endonuclease